MSSLNRVVNLLTGRPWAIVPSAYDQLREIVMRRASGERLSASEIEARVGSKQRDVQSFERRGNVAIVPIHGPIVPRGGMMNDVSGATSTEQVRAMFDGAMSDESVDTVLFDVDSPGGDVGGIDELSAHISASRGRKRIVSLANHDMASAAYWIGTAADEVVAAPSAIVGSIGVIAEHRDYSAADAAQGKKVTVLTTAKNKAHGHPSQPLSDEARDSVMEMLQGYHADFVSRVARNRGVSADLAGGEQFGEGDVFKASEALRRGMIDRVADFHSLMADLVKPEPVANGISVSRRRAEIERRIAARG